MFFLNILEKNRLFIVLGGETINGLVFVSTPEKHLSCFFFYQPGPELTNGCWNTQKLTIVFFSDYFSDHFSD